MQNVVDSTTLKKRKTTTTTTMATTTTVSEASRRVNALLVRVRCERCEKSAYPAESVDVDGKRWHRGCFKCFECGTTLSLTTFVTCDGEVYCAKDGLARQRAKRERDAERTETREEDPAAVIEPKLAVERRLAVERLAARKIARASRGEIVQRVSVVDSHRGRTRERFVGVDGETIGVRARFARRDVGAAGHFEDDSQ